MGDCASPGQGAGVDGVDVAPHGFIHHPIIVAPVRLKGAASSPAVNKSPPSGVPRARRAWGDECSGTPAGRILRSPDVMDVEFAVCVHAVFGPGTPK